MADTVVASDDANGRNALGANWSQVASSTQGDVTVTPTGSNNSTYFTANSGGETVARWVGAGSFTNDQGASAALVTFSLFSGGAIGVVCRCSADTDGAKDYYLCQLIDDSGNSTKTVQLTKRVNGTETVLSTGSTTWTAGDRIGIRATGTTIQALKNGAQIGSMSVTDSSLSTGAPGIRCCSGYTLDDWQGFNVTAGGGAIASLAAFLFSQMNG